MPREQYRQQLWELRGEVAALGDLVCDRYAMAVEALTSGDSRTADRVIDGDTEINEWYLDTEARCTKLVALQQPVAGDLRFITASFKILTDLERVGDLATNLARYGREAGGDLSETVALEPLATTAGEMVEDALRAYARDDADAARAVAERDDDLDDACADASETVVREMMAANDPELEPVSRTLLAIRDIERVGDHAVNVCARTVYMVDREDDLIY
ncbi:phosphate signaling complex protein PhoU [Halovenus salina]|uniref:Phosphate-specific transport system accessory protein PhoU n=1 Tax=Halovenus salina TaxID=1510225 RepID=A0ABD5VZY0_9EURY|nr:phosphate signaling complex protein PhoU [Halovenus salina]